MTISSTVNRLAYTGNGSTTAFSVSFKFIDPEDLVLYVDDAIQVLDTDYTVSGGAGSTGTVTFSTAPVSAERITILRDPAVLQETDYSENDNFPAETHERALDRLTMIAQRNRDLLDRSLTLSDSAPVGVSTALPAPAANEVIAWNETGDALTNKTVSALSTAIVGASITRNAFDGDGSETEFTLSSAPQTDNNLRVYVGGIYQDKTEWTLDGNVLTFNSPPPSGNDNIVCLHQAALTYPVTSVPDGAILQSSIDPLYEESLLKQSDIGESVGAYLESASPEEMAAGTETALRAMSPLNIAQAIASLASGFDQGARDQIALTNLRLMLNTGVTTGALSRGWQWELATDEWASSSTNEVYVSGSIGYYTNAQSSLPSTSGLTKIGDMTSGVGGGLSAAFDGNESQTETTSARKESATVAYIGLDWGSGNTKKVSAFWIKGSSDQGFVANINPTVTVTIQGSSDNFSSSVVDLGSASGTDSNGLVIQNVALDSSVAYRYHRAKIEHNGAANPVLCAELKLYELAVTDVTLVPPSSVSVSSNPSYISSYLLYKDDSGSAALGTDITVELSRDGGTTYATSTISSVASFDGTYSIIRARADVSGQPSGAAMMCRIKTFNNKAQRIAAPAIYAE